MLAHMTLFWAIYTQHPFFLRHRHNIVTVDRLISSTFLAQARSAIHTFGTGWCMLPAEASQYIRCTQSMRNEWLRALDRSCLATSAVAVSCA